VSTSEGELLVGCCLEEFSFLIFPVSVDDSLSLGDGARIEFCFDFGNDSCSSTSNGRKTLQYDSRKATTSKTVVHRLMTDPGILIVSSYMAID